jgi:hypothetical protein
MNTRSIAGLYAGVALVDKPKNERQTREARPERRRVRYFRGFGPEPSGRPTSVPSDLIALDSAAQFDYW